MILNGFLFLLLGIKACSALASYVSLYDNATINSESKSNIVCVES